MLLNYLAMLSLWCVMFVFSVRMTVEFTNEL